MKSLGNTARWLWNCFEIEKKQTKQKENEERRVHVKTKTIGMIAVLLAVVLTVAAQSAEKDTFWETLKIKLSKITPAKKLDVTTSVAGVRGAKEGTESDIYWKGKDKSELVTEEELQAFRLAMEAKDQGKNDEALKQFEAFLNGYPQSPLRLDALQAVEKIKMELGLMKPLNVKDEALVDAGKEDVSPKASAKTVKKATKKKKTGSETQAK